MEYVWPVCLGLCLAACAGLRAFVPLLVVGALFRAGHLEPNEAGAWLGSTPALIVLGVATVVEIVADKFPAVDHVLDVVQSFVRPAAGVIVTASVLTDMDPVTAGVIAVIIGVPTSGVVHAAKASGRLVSTATTGGTANPILSMAEDVGALVLVVLALVLLPLAVVLVAVLLFACVKLTLSAWRLLRHRLPAMWRQVRRRVAWQWRRIVLGAREPKPRFCGQCLLEIAAGEAACARCEAAA